MNIVELMTAAPQPAQAGLGRFTWDHLATIIAHLRTHAPKVTAIGRYGAFKYNNQDHSILMGILAAENLAANTRHDLWSINTDYTDYQEEIGE